MTDVAVPELTADEARTLTDEIRSDLTAFLPKVKRAFEGRADKALGYDSWQEYSAAELNDVRVPVGSRPAMAAELRQSGMGVRAIGAALGVSKDTVARDLSRVSDETPAPAPSSVTGLDGKRYTPPPSPAERLKAAVADFPELEHYADQPAKAAALADQLRSFDPAEREERRENLAKAIRAEKEGRLDPKPNPGDAALGVVDRLFLAANAAAREAEKVGVEKAIAGALPHADPMQIELWREQFTHLGEMCTRIADACRPQLRRVQ